MNNYQINVFNSTSMYNSIMLSKQIINNLSEKLYNIDLCDIKSTVNSLKPWIGMTNSLNCNVTYLDYYISRNMNMIITPIGFEIENIPHGAIKYDLFKILSEYNDFEIQTHNNKIMTFENTTSSIILYILLLSVSIKFIMIFLKKLHDFTIESIGRRKLINQIK